MDWNIIPHFFAVLIGAEIFIHGLTNNLGQVRNVTGIFRQMWYRPILSVLVNLISSIILVHVIGIHGVIIGTLLSSLLTNLLFDPLIIYKYGFDNYKSFKSYYIKNSIYLIVLIAMIFLNIWIFTFIQFGNGWISAIIHVVIVGIDVPLAFLIVFYKTPECRYMVNIARNILK